MFLTSCPAKRDWYSPSCGLCPQEARQTSEGRGGQAREGEEGRRGRGLSLIHISEPTRPRLI
eukprot:2227761-Rhodomonas_salina.1